MGLFEWDQNINFSETPFEAQLSSLDENWT